MSRQGVPARTRQRIPLMSCRLVHVGGSPGFFPTGSSGCSTAHCASVRSARPVSVRLDTRSPVFSIFLVVDRCIGDLDYLINDTPTRRLSEGYWLVNTSKHGLGAHRW